MARRCKRRRWWCVSVEAAAQCGTARYIWITAPTHLSLSLAECGRVPGSSEGVLTPTWNWSWRIGRSESSSKWRAMAVQEGLTCAGHHRSGTRRGPEAARVSMIHETAGRACRGRCRARTIWRHGSGAQNSSGEGREVVVVGRRALVVTSLVFAAGQDFRH